TAGHLVAKASSEKKVVEVRVAGRDGKPAKTLKAEVLACNAETDLAILRLAADDIPMAVSLAPAAKDGARESTPKPVVSVGWEKGDAPTALDEEVKTKVHLKRPGE